MTHLKTLISIILFLASTGILSSFANDGTSLTISGKSTIYDFVTETYEASASNGEITSCRWSQSDPVSNAYVDVTPRGNQCDVTFRSYGGITLNCNADIKIGETPKPASSSKIIRCCPPPINGDPSIDIEGPSEVTLNSTKTYNAIHSGTKDTPSFTWRYHGQTRSGESTEIHFVTNGTVHLECTMSYKDNDNNDQSLSDDMDIHVLPQVELSAMRADYKNYTNAIISGTNDVYIHFNIDDDDKSYNNEDNRGTDCKQREFANGGLDDDLCKIELSLGANINPEKITNGTLIFETSEGLRLWKSPYRTQFILGQKQTTGYSFSDPKVKTEILRILRDGIYVEGVLPGQHSLTIRLADKELILPYVCCSVGGINDQPNGNLRKFYKEEKDFQDLVDCEWCVKPLNDPFYETFNCIAYAIDPNKTIFNNSNIYVNPFCGSFWITSKMTDVPGFDNQANPENISEPFYVNVYIKIEYWDSLSNASKTILTNKCLSFIEEPLFVYIDGYKKEFLDEIRNIRNFHDNNMFIQHYKSSMNLFNVNDKANFTLDDADAFFTSSKWAMEKCNSVDDADRKIIYYQGINNPEKIFHAARALKHTPYKDEIEKTINSDWKMAVSKCGDFPELLIHCVNQITDKYGEVKSAYK